jgi:hypothetical protein
MEVDMKLDRSAVIGFTAALLCWGVIFGFLALMA